MTPEDLGRSRLAALTGAGDPGRLGTELLAGARGRTDQARRLAEAAVAVAEQPARRWAVSWRAAVAGAVALAVVAGVVVLRTLSGAPEVLVSTASAPAGGTVAAESGTTAAPSPDTITVHVVGAVRHPGVVTVPSGSRAVDAVAAAGGAAEDADLAGVNLARPLSDGEQVVVPAAGDPSVPAGGSAGGALDLNSADAGALEALPRIGPVLAERIVAWRTEHGRFSSVAELAEVPGIGPTLLAALDGLVRV